MEETLLIIKPDAVKKGFANKIIDIIKKEKFKIIEVKETKLSKKLCSKFYEVHKGKEFFNSLIDFMSSGEIIVCRLKRDNAVEYLREIVGATNPMEAKENTIRKLFGTSICENAVHASDSKNTAEKEINFFFK